ncbi:amino acid adenylation domain-containing protein, partial [Actinoplanes sp. GCM10030250]|uniref:non-ribosomal peptide synthetase n=1 Tax=Actinoplanes sp. GCM10030250 TaxID=3273376 RepID=UPI00361D785A
IGDVLVLVLHHIACDGWSLRPLARDLAEAYAARCAGRAPDLPPLPVQYADYAVWQRELLSELDPDSLAARQLDYWRTQLADLPDGTGLATDRPRPATRTYAGDVAAFEVGAELHRRLTELGQQHRASFFMVVQAGLAALLTRLGAGTDIPLGTAVAGRNDPALDDLVGFFVNTLVLRSDTSGRPTFHELLDRVRETDLAAYANQDVPFDRVVEEINPDRHTDRSPLFQIMLGFQNTAEATFELAGLHVDEPTGAFSQPHAKYDLEVIVRERPGGGAEGLLLYSTDLFDATTVRTLLDRLMRFFEGVAADPGQPVTDIDILSADERRLIFEAPRQAGPGRTMPELLRSQAEQHPDRTALVCGGDRLTYRELNERANRLAHRLIEMGIGPEDLVAVSLPRSTELVVALLGVLKAGAGYVPIDQDYPAERVALMLEDAQPRHVIDTPEAVDGPPGPSHEPDIRPAPGSVAYVIYTSGSTGRPKGVVVEHRALADYLAWTTSEYASAGGVAQVHTSIAFDLTVTALYTPLAMGGCVVLTAPDQKGPSVAAEQCTFLKATPSHLPLLNPLPGDFLAGGDLLLGGEALTGEALAAWRQRHPDVTVRNVYGPTEATVNCAEFCIPPGEEISPGPVPIGRPQANARLYVLDHQLQPVAPGVTGDLYIAGTGLARGYLGQRALTGARFVADLYGPPGTRMYRSGDLARWRRDGQLEFVGRADDQLKVRGFRVEPGEIEAALRTLPGIDQAVIVADEQQRLVAYVTPAGIDTAAVREQAARVLPPHMVPEFVVPLERLPLTAHGKLDRTALPAPGPAGRTTDRVLPRNATEQALAAIWSDLLGVEQIGVTESFFDLGGHSLLAARLLGRIREDLGAAIPPQAIFATPTVEMLARQIDGLAAPETGAVFDPRLTIDELLPTTLPPAENAPPRHLLLTGATGFVGSDLAAELLRRPDITVHCLVRAAGTATALDRIHGVLEPYGLRPEETAGRLRVIVGDLAAPRLGLTAKAFDDLAGEIDTILHNGAQVDALRPYAQLAEVNIGGTGELLRLAATCRRKRFHYVSTVSVAAAEEGLHSSGYAQTKLDAERLVRAAGERGLETAVYRLPRITGETRYGRHNDRDIMFRLLRVVFDLGVAPDLGLEEDWIPVDQAARRLAALATEPPGGRRILLTAERPVRIDEFLDQARRRGRAMRVVPVDEWLTELADRNPDEHALLSQIVHSRSGPAVRRGQQGFAAVVAGGVDETTLQHYLDHLITKGDRRCGSHVSSRPAT